MVIYLDRYQNAKAARSLPSEERYSEELLYANWNPMVAISATLSDQCLREYSPPLPNNLATIDCDAFLNRVYALASRI